MAAEVVAQAVPGRAVHKALAGRTGVAKAAALEAAHSRHQPAAVARARKAAALATAMTMHNPRAPTPILALTWAIATQATAAPVMVQAASPTPCAPAWTAWLNAVAAVVAVDIAIPEVVDMVADQARVAVVAGATGLVGQAVLAALLTAESRTEGNAAGGAGGAIPPSARTSAPSSVHVLYAQGRRAPALSHPRMHLLAVDFADISGLPPVDDVYITLGTTMAAAGSQSAFRAVDHDAVLATARAARDAGATRCGVVTAMGANARSRIFYNRVKGEVERDLKAIGFETLVIARPSLLIGERQALAQAARPAESLSIRLFRWLNPLIPADYRARPGADVARALVHAVQSLPPGTHVLTGRSLQGL